MPQEYFDIVDENNIPTGEIKSREEVHQKLIDYHRVVVIWILNDRSEILCQKRSEQKDDKPGLWQSFLGGHIKSGTTVEDAIKDELSEEIGLDIVNLGITPQFLDLKKWDKSRHFGYIHILEWNGDIADLVFRDGEVTEAKWLSLEALQEEISAGKIANKISPEIQEYIQTRKSNS